MERYISKHKAKLFLFGTLLGLPIVLSLSGHFFLFWLRTVKVKIAILMVLIPLMGLVIGFLLSVLEKQKRKVGVIGYTTLLIFAAFLVTFSTNNGEFFPYPPGTTRTYILSLVSQGEKNVESSADSVELIRIVKMPVKYEEREKSLFIYLAKRDCEGDWLQLEEGFFGIKSSPGAELRCHFSANPNDQIRLVFVTSPASGFVQVMARAEGVGRTIDANYDLYSPVVGREGFIIQIPHSSSSLFVRLLDILSSAIVINIILVVIIKRFPIQTIILWFFMLLSIGMVIYLVLFPALSGYTIARDRYDLQFSEWPQFEQMIRDINRYVPEDATLAIIYPGKYPVSPMFGPRYARRLLPQYPAPENISVEYLNTIQADYLLMSAELFETDKLGDDGQLHFVIYGGGEVLYPNYSLDNVLKSGLEIVVSCVQKSHCRTMYYLFKIRR